MSFEHDLQAAAKFEQDLKTVANLIKRDMVVIAVLAFLAGAGFALLLGAMA